MHRPGAVAFAQEALAQEPSIAAALRIAVALRTAEALRIAVALRIAEVHIAVAITAPAWAPRPLELLPSARQQRRHIIMAIGRVDIIPIRPAIRCTL